MLSDYSSPNSPKQIKKDCYLSSSEEKEDNLGIFSLLNNFGKEKITFKKINKNLQLPSFLQAFYNDKTYSFPIEKNEQHQKEKLAEQKKGYFKIPAKTYILSDFFYESKEEKIEKITAVKSDSTNKICIVTRFLNCHDNYSDFDSDSNSDHDIVYRSTNFREKVEKEQSIINKFYSLSFSPFFYKSLKKQIEKAYVFLPFFKGETLESFLFKNLQSLTLQKAIEICHKIAKQLEKLHSKDIVHGDLKPANFMVSNDEIYLIDFEFSRTVGEILTGFSGNYIFFSYEALFSEMNYKIQIESEVFSLALIFYYILFKNHPPFDHSQKKEQCQLELEQLVQDIQHSDTNKTLKDMLIKMLDKIPENRLKTPEICKILESTLTNMKEEITQAVPELTYTQHA